MQIDTSLAIERREESTAQVDLRTRYFPALDGIRVLIERLVLSDVFRSFLEAAVDDQIRRFGRRSCDGERQGRKEGDGSQQYAHGNLVIAPNDDSLVASEMRAPADEGLLRNLGKRRRLYWIV